MTVEQAQARQDMDTNQDKEQPPVRYLWIDADPSGLVWTGLDCDDDLAILAALSYLHKHQNAGNFKLAGISACGGNAPLKHTYPNLIRLLQSIQHVSPIAKGYGWSQMQPLTLKFLQFFQTISPDWTNHDPDQVPQAIIDTLRPLPPQSLTILMLGPSTNLARAYELQPRLLEEKLSRVVLMGGELTNQKLDLNFLLDRKAARKILMEMNVSTAIVPIQTCGQVVVTREVVDAFASNCNCHTHATNGGSQKFSSKAPPAACALLPKMKLQISLMPWLVNRAVSSKFPDTSKKHVSDKKENEKALQWNPSPNLDQGFIPWDVVALLAVLAPNDMFEDWSWHRVDMPSCGHRDNNSRPYGRLDTPCHWTMGTVHPTRHFGRHPPAVGAAETLNSSRSNAFLDYRGWVHIPHTVRDEDAMLKFTFLDLLCDLPLRQTDFPKMHWGYLGHLVMFLGMLLLCFYKIMSLFIGSVSCLMVTARRGGRNKTRMKNKEKES